MLSFVSLPAYAGATADEGKTATASAAKTEAAQKAEDKEAEDCSSGKTAHNALCNMKSKQHLGIDKKLKTITLHKKAQTLKPLF